MKKCSKCGKLKRESEFPKDRTRKDGLHQRCKACKNAYSRQHYKTMQDAPGSGPGMKSCSSCEKLKPMSEFSRDRTKKDGLYHLCKVCRSAYRRKNKEVKKTTLKSGKNAGAANYDNGDVGVLAIVYAGVEYGVCSVCSKRLMGYIPGYLHGQPVCKDCVIVSMKAMFKKKRVKK
ncbi:MAG: hypothetical protein JRG75_03325 [Deltaproteobacteria bacterium]|nr:hypothetical protein [Deltaproteobacteria bacterium]